MDSLYEIIRDVPTFFKSVPLTCRQAERLVIPSTSTSNTERKMPLKWEKMYKKVKVVMKKTHLSYSADKINVHAVESIDIAVHMHRSRQTECNESLIKNKVALEKLSMNSNLATLSDEELVDTLKTIIAFNEIFIAGKPTEIYCLLVIKEELDAVLENIGHPFSVDRELGCLKNDLQSFKAKHKVQESIFVDIINLWDTVLYNFPITSSTVIDLLSSLQSQNESIEQMWNENTQEIILDEINVLIDALLKRPVLTIL